MTRATLIHIIKTNGRLTDEQAEVAFRTFQRKRCLKYNAHDGWNVKHGGFLDADVIRRAWAVGQAHEEGK